MFVDEFWTTIDWRQWQEQRREVLAIEVFLIRATNTLKALVFFCVLLGISCCLLRGAGHELYVMRSASSIDCLT